MTIRSFRRVFKFERRIYNIGDWQLPFPNGLPLRGIGYAVGAFAAVFVLTRLVLIGDALELVPWPVLYGVLPVWLAAAGMNYNPDGRRADRFAWTWLRHNTARLAAWVRRDRGTVLGKVRVHWDESNPEPRRSKVTGPATARFMHPVRFEDRWNGWTATGSPDGTPRSVHVTAGKTLKVRP